MISNDFLIKSIISEVFTKHYNHIQNFAWLTIKILYNIPNHPISIKLVRNNERKHKHAYFTKPKKNMYLNKRHTEEKIVEKKGST